MATNISRLGKVTVEKPVVFTQARVLDIIYRPNKTTSRRLLIADTGEEKTEAIDIPVSVRKLPMSTIIGWLETHLQQAIDLDELTLENFLHSIVHECAKQQGD